MRIAKNDLVRLPIARLFSITAKTVITFMRSSRKMTPARKIEVVHRVPDKASDNSDWFERSIMSSRP